jgi:hypothetical protein
MTRQPIGLHASTHLPGGSDPVPTGGGIDFNQLNTEDSDGTIASYLDEEIAGTSPLQISPTEYGQWLTTGDKENIGYRDDVSSSGTHSTQVLQNESGQTRIVNTADGALFDISGTDFLGTSLKVLAHGTTVVFADSQSVTRNGSYVITALSYTNAFFKINHNQAFINVAQGISLVSGFGSSILMDAPTGGAPIIELLSGRIDLNIGSGAGIVELGGGSGPTWLYLDATDVEIGHSFAPSTISIVGTALTIGAGTTAGNLKITGALRTTAPAGGSGQWWNNGGVVTIA